LKFNCDKEFPADDILKRREKRGGKELYFHGNKHKGLTTKTEVLGGFRIKEKKGKEKRGEKENRSGEPRKEKKSGRSCERGRGEKSSEGISNRREKRRLKKSVLTGRKRGGWMRQKTGNV